MTKKVLLLSFAVVLTALTFAQIPGLLNYQAVVRNSSNELIANQQVGLKISIVLTADTNHVVFSEVHTPISNNNGLISVAIGSINSLNAVDWAAGPFSLKTELDPAGGDNYSISGISPLLSVPYALYARTAGASAGSNEGWGVVGDHAVFHGFVGINSTDKRSRLSVAEYDPSDQTTTLYSHATGGVSIAGFSSAESDRNWMNVGVMGMVHTKEGTTGRGVSGQASGDGIDGFGIFGESRLNNAVNNGVLGYALSRTGNNFGQFGGFFVARGDWDPEVGVGNGDHFGIIGRAEGKGPWGLGASLRSSGATNINRGVQGVGSGNTGPFNQGGVFFGTGTGNDASNTENVGAAGSASDNRLANVGLRGQAFGGVNPQSKVTGVQGYAAGFGGQEAFAMDAWTNARQYRNYALKAFVSGIVGGDSINYGVYSDAINGATNYAVYAVANGDANNEKVNYGIYAHAAGGTEANYAGFFNGDVTVTGNLNVTGQISKGSGTFRIDHPLDPQNKYLVHSFVESPEMLNVYSGNITTDANGYARVALPSYFEAANTDFRYQLTVIGTFAQAIIRQEVQNNVFVIQTSEPRVKVSWQVTGVRNDPFAQKNRVQPEQRKDEKDRGTYLHPEIYGSDRGENNARTRVSASQRTGEGVRTVPVMEAQIQE